MNEDTEKRSRWTIHPETLERIETLLDHEQGEKKKTVDAKLNMIFDRLQKENTGITPRQIFTMLGMTPEEQTFVLDVFNTANVDFAHVMRTAMLAQCKSLVKSYARLDSVDVDDPEARMGQRGAAEKHLHGVATQLMADNDSASNPRDTVYLSLQVLKTVARSGKSQVVAYRRKYAAMLAEHHARHGWTDEVQGNRHNRLVSEKYKALMGDEEFTNEQA